MKKLNWKAFAAAVITAGFFVQIPVMAEEADMIIAENPAAETGAAIETEAAKGTLQIDGVVLIQETQVSPEAAQTASKMEEVENGVAQTEAATEAAQTEAATEEATEAVQTEVVTEAATEAVQTEAVTEAAQADDEIEVVEDVTEAATEAATEEATEAVTEEATEAATEAATEEATEAVTEEATEAATEAATEEATEAATEEAADVAENAEYRFENDEVIVKAVVEVIPADAQMKVTKLAEGSAEYEAAKAAAGDVESAQYSFYSISFVADGQELEMADGSVSVQIEFKSITENTQLLKISEGTADEITAQNGSVNLSM